MTMPEDESKFTVDQLDDLSRRAIERGRARRQQQPGGTLEDKIRVIVEQRPRRDGR